MWSVDFVDVGVEDGWYYMWGYLTPRRHTLTVLSNPASLTEALERVVIQIDARSFMKTWIWGAHVLNWLKKDSQEASSVYKTTQALNWQSVVVSYQKRSEWRGWKMHINFPSILNCGIPESFSNYHLIILSSTPRLCLFTSHQLWSIDFYHHLFLVP